MQTIVVGILTFYALFFIVVKIIDFVFCGGWKRKREQEAKLKFDPAPNWRGRFITDAELEVAGAFDNRSGICVGVSRASGRDREIFYNPDENEMLGIITLGGMGSLKTTSMHIPLALRWGLED